MATTVGGILCSFSLQLYTKEQKSGTFAREGRQRFYSLASYVLAKESSTLYVLLAVPITYVACLYYNMDTIVHWWARGFHIYFALTFWFTGFSGLVSLLMSELSALLTVGIVPSVLSLLWGAFPPNVPGVPRWPGTSGRQ